MRLKRRTPRFATRSRALLGLLLLLKLLDLAALAFDLLLLILNHALLLLVGVLLVLQRAADHVSAARSERSADRRAGERMTDCRAHQRSRASAQNAAAESALSGGGHPLLTASAKPDGNREHEPA